MNREGGKLDLGIEGLRAIACLFVLLCHVTKLGNIDPQSPLPTLINAIHSFLLLGKEGVLLFFLISGYVIGLNYQNVPYSRAQTGTFLWKRAVRLVPLCWLAIIVSVTLCPVDPWNRIIGHFLFLQNINRVLFIYVGPISANGNLWSLNFELIYYLTFLLIWKWRPTSRQLGGLMAVLFAVTLNGWFFKVQSRCLAPYTLGGLYWCAGLWLAWYGPKADRSARVPWVSLFLLFLATSQLDFVRDLFLHAGWAGWAKPHRQPYISIMDVSMLPIAFLFLAAATQRLTRWMKSMLAFVLVAPLLQITMWIAFQDQAAIGTHVLALSYWALAILCLPWAVGNRWINVLSPIGMISYGIYIFGPAMESLVVRHLPIPGGLWWSFFAKSGLIIALTFVMAYWTERKLQPMIKDYLNRRFSQPKPQAATNRPEDLPLAEEAS